MGNQSGFTEALRESISKVTAEPSGLQERSAATACVINAPRRSGLEIWSIPLEDTRHAWNIRVTEEVSERPGFAGRSAVAGKGMFSLQLRAQSECYLAAGPVTFGPFYLTAGLVARDSQGVGQSELSLHSLRDDLITVADRNLWLLLDHYVLRRRDLAKSTEPDRDEGTSAANCGAPHYAITCYYNFRKTIPRTGDLASRKLEHVCDAMISEIGGGPSLGELAATIGCLPTDFSRAFKQSAGLAAFQRLHQQRVEKAKALLEENPRLTVAEIALKVRCSAQPKFTTDFGRATATTPGAWRRASMFR